MQLQRSEFPSLNILNAVQRKTGALRSTFFLTVLVTLLQLPAGNLAKTTAMLFELQGCDPRVGYQSKLQGYKQVNVCMCVYTYIYTYIHI